MQSVLEHTSKLIVDKSAMGSGVLPYLPLPQLSEPPAAPPAAAANAPANAAQPARGTSR
jgi:hypothetical protein